MPVGTLIRKTRLAREESGFSLIEMLIVLAVIAILLAIAIPSYLGFRERAHRSAAQANLRTALPALAAYHVDNDSYTGLTLAALQGYDQAVSGDIAILSSSATSFCVRSTRDGQSYYKNGPSGSITATPCT